MNELESRKFSCKKSKVFWVLIHQANELKVELLVVVVLAAAHIFAVLHFWVFWWTD